MRTKISPTFSTGKMKSMFDIISHITDNLVNVIISNSGIDTCDVNISENIANYSTDIISNIAFGLESNCEFSAF
jgi:cytochrome P450 family 6